MFLFLYVFDFYNILDNAVFSSKYYNITIIIEVYNVMNITWFNWSKV